MHETKAPKPAEIMAAGITQAHHHEAMLIKCAKEKVEERRVNSAAVLNDEAASIYEACMAKLRDGSIEYDARSCTIVVDMPSKSALHVHSWRGIDDFRYDDEIKTRLAHHFAVDNIKLDYMTVVDVGCGSVYRSTQITGECRHLCCWSSMLCGCIPLLAYWMPMAAYQRFAGDSARHTCKYSVTLSLKATQKCNKK